jgi:hypothetical protein
LQTSDFLSVEKVKFQSFQRRLLPKNFSRVFVSVQGKFFVIYSRGGAGAISKNLAAICLCGLRAHLLSDANLIRQLDELTQIPPFFFAHQSAFRTRKIDRNESVGGKGRPHDELCFLMFRERLGHLVFLQRKRIVSRVALLFGFGRVNTG